MKDLEPIRRQLLVVGGIAILACIYSRTPEWNLPSTVFGVPIPLNVGQVITFSPAFFLAAMLYLQYRIDAVRGPRVPERAPMLLVMCSVPGIANLFLLRQFAFEFVPQEAECNAYSHVRFFWDIALMKEGWFKPRLCFSVSDELQNQMPYILPPVQTWIYAIVAAATLWVGWRVWRRWPRVEET